MRESGKDRAITSTVSNALIASLVIVLAMTVGVFAETTTNHLSEKPPTARFETTSTEGILHLTHTGGEAIPANQLQVRGGTIVGEKPARLAAGSTLKIAPSKTEVRLITTGSDGEVSTVLLTVNAPDATVPESAFTTLPDSKPAQYDLFRSINLSDPFLLRVTATTDNGTSFSGNDTVTIQITDHRGGCCDAPEDRYYEAGVRLDFDENGSAYVEFGNTNTADVAYWGLGVNDITEGIVLHNTTSYEASLAINQTTR